MDSNPVAPFDMYIGEYILWMEERNKEEDTLKLKIIIGVLLLLTLLGSVFWFINLYIKNNAYFLVSLLLPFICLWCPWMLFFLLLKCQSEKVIYYVTNYRLIKLFDSKVPRVFYDFIEDLKNIEISTYPNNFTSLEFEWKNENQQTYSCSVFENINNAEEVYNIILEQKEKLSNRPMSFDIISQ